MRRVAARSALHVPQDVRRVVALPELAAQWREDQRFAVLVHDEQDRARVEQLSASGLANVAWVRSDALELGDVVVLRGAQQAADVKFRRADQHHTLFLTNRCNSRCLMCSQPPTDQDDSWLVEQARDILRHMDHSPASIGITGGEPTLLGQHLRALLDELAQTHPSTAVELLTNGRLLGSPDHEQALLRGLAARVRWLVPLYGHADFLHDFVVQSPGAFEETIAGILALQSHGQPIQLRIVLIEPVLEVLAELCGYVGRNLPFVSEVALMACEPIGFALANREQCEVDLLNWRETLEAATRTLQRHRVPFVFMNTPHCALPNALWPHARRSISDWKNVYADACDGCGVRQRCSGLFAWHERGWKPSRVRPINNDEEATT